MKLRGPFLLGFESAIDIFQKIFNVLDATQVDPTTAHIALAFTSLQTSANGPGGDTCDNWSLLYTMTQNSDGSWLIDGTTGYHGKEHTTC